MPLFFLLALAVIYLERTWHFPKLIVTPVASAVGALAVMVSITLLSLSFDFFIRRGDTRR